MFKKKREGEREREREREREEVKKCKEVKVNSIQRGENVNCLYKGIE